MHFNGESRMDAAVAITRAWVKCLCDDAKNALPHKFFTIAINGPHKLPE